MTPERWQQVDELFDAALRLDPPERTAWLLRECGDDHALRASVDQLLDHDAKAARDGFLTPLELPQRHHEPSPNHSTHGDSRSASAADDETVDFPRNSAPIVRATGTLATAEPGSVLRPRLSELVVVYLTIFGMSSFWRHVVLRRFDSTISVLHAVVLTALACVAALLFSRRPLSQSRLRLVELGVVAMLAFRVNFAQYWSMLTYSLRNDPMSAQRAMQNDVLLTSILILTSGIYVPKTWRRAAAIAAPLALLPFATLFVLHQRHPDAMIWLSQPGPNGTTPIGLYGYDALLLLTLAVVSARGANTIHRLRKQVVEARQLGQYRLRQRIGSGGMGEVYLADHQLLKRPCAVKLIRPNAAADPRALDRFEREVRITASLSHWNTVEIFDYGRTDEGTYYYVMEYLPGLSLADLVERHGALPPGRVVFLLRQVCMALREAHAAGLIHRDIKPSNIFAAQRGGLDDVAKLLDFGLVLSMVKARGADARGDVQVAGTPLFMSPEQALGGRELDERSDIYSLGTVAYYLLTGRPPFKAGSGVGAMIAHAREPVVAPSRVHADIPDDLERVVLRCLAKAPGDRYQDAQSVELALADCACVGDWDSARASLWWRDKDRDPVVAGASR